MSTWTQIRDRVSDLIDTNGSTVVITPKTPATGSYGGYEPGSDANGTTVTTVGIASNQMINRTGEKFGTLKEGDIEIFLKYGESLTKDYGITWNSDNYRIKSIRTFKADDVIVAYKVALVREID